MHGDAAAISLVRIVLLRCDGSMQEAARRLKVEPWVLEYWRRLYLEGR